MHTRIYTNKTTQKKLLIFNYIQTFISFIKTHQRRPISHNHTHYIQTFGEHQYTKLYIIYIMRLCDILSPDGIKPAKNFAFSQSVRHTTRHHTKHNDKKFILPHTKTLTRTQIQKQTKFLQINAPNAPENHAKSHNRNCHKTQKSQQTVKNAQHVLLYPNQQPLKRRKPAKIRHFFNIKPITTTDKQQLPPMHTDTSYSPDTHNALDTPEFQKTSEFTPFGLPRCDCTPQHLVYHIVNTAFF